MSLAECWNHIKKRNPVSPDEFMRVLFESKPDLDEHMIIRWQRASRDWTTEIFDFIWVVLQTHHGNSEWTQQVESIWPRIKATIDEHCLDDLMANMTV